MWARNQLDWERVDNGQTESATVTISIVGSVLEGTEPCRWIELKYEVADGGETGTLLQKLLISEKGLLESNNPMEHVLRTWTCFNDEPARLKDPRLNNDSVIGPLLLWAPGGIATARKAGPSRDIEYQRGVLKGASSRSQKVILPETNIDGKVVLKRSRTFTIQMHGSLPIGLAEAQVDDELFDVEMTTVRARQISKYFLQDFGSGATTKLPNNN
jgi:hypothetical protein